MESEREGATRKCLRVTGTFFPTRYSPEFEPGLDSDGPSLLSDFDLSYYPAENLVYKILRRSVLGTKIPKPTKGSLVTYYPILWSLHQTGNRR